MLLLNVIIIKLVPTFKAILLREIIAKNYILLSQLAITTAEECNFNNKHEIFVLIIITLYTSADDFAGWHVMHMFSVFLIFFGYGL